MVVHGSSNHSQSRPSLAGSWGQETLKNYNQLNGTTIGRNDRNPEHLQTVAASTYTAEVFQKSRDTCPTKHHRFRALQQSGSAVVGNSYEPVDTLGFTTHNNLMEALAEEQRGQEKLSTTFRDSFTPYLLPGQDASSVDLTKYGSKVTFSGEIPIAMGRSGLRKEKGVSTSGLCGERLMLTEEPKKNTLAQKSWLYSDDPAVMYKINGRPQAPIVTENSITLPAELNNDQSYYDVNKSHARRYVVTGDILSKTGDQRARIFLDDRDQEVMEKHFGTSTLRK